MCVYSTKFKATLRTTYAREDFILSHSLSEKDDLQSRVILNKTNTDQSEIKINDLFVFWHIMLSNTNYMCQLIVSEIFLNFNIMLTNIYVKVSDYRK